MMKMTQLYYYITHIVYIWIDTSIFLFFVNLLSSILNIKRRRWWCKSKNFIEFIIFIEWKIKFFFIGLILFCFFLIYLSSFNLFYIFFIGGILLFLIYSTLRSFDRRRGSHSRWIFIFFKQEIVYCWN